MVRKQLNPKKRFLVLNRDNFTCQYCGLKAWRWVQLQVDHIKPVSKWGTNDLENLTTSCFECNIWKGSSDEEKIEELLYKTKIWDNIGKKLKELLKTWNKLGYWNIDWNTMALLKITYSTYLWSDQYCQFLDTPYYIDNHKPYYGDMEELDKEFKKGGSLCDEVLDLMEPPLGWYDNYIDTEIEDDTMWKGKCKDSMNNRLNYRLTEILHNSYKEGVLKNNYSIKKFSYFYNEILNG